MNANEKKIPGKKFFISSTFLTLSIGIPFCVFKLLFGVLAQRIGSAQGTSYLIIFGWLIIFWATIDLIMNLARMTQNLLKNEETIEYCSLAQCGRFFKRPSLFLCIDTGLSFLIISFVLLTGWIKELKYFESHLWCIATAINLISLAIVNIWFEYHMNSDNDGR